MPRAALYARVSTLDQRTDAQLDALRAYAANRGLEVAGEHVDHGVSGAKDRRPALDAMLQGAGRRAFDVLVVTKLDRLARSVRHLTALVADLEALGVGLVVLDQGIDTTTPTGRLLFHVLGAIAEFERDLIRERVAAGMRAAKRRGKVFGRRRALEGERLERLRELRALGKPHRQIATALGVSQPTVTRALAELRRGRDRRAA
jgi:DNA invertase Pin-like site-specific DNA recombinase